ncbi:ATP-dependent nuclease [Erythrobacter neustonensis]|uniref:OLD family endonuclease n=1 Tax=Erythrobacter neustonensis TaxID=1112 RepID=A0A192D808_9SPHN|nr:AAA family ATPase [Erythrobacter neustonensis]ANK13899.1 OLD family endonuclease [Erythrobacter neustonensis]
MLENAQLPADEAPYIRLLSIKRFRGIEDLTWLPAKGVNVLLGGGDVGKTTILEAIALLLSPTNATTLSDADYWKRRHEDGFEISAVMALPLSCGIVEQRKAVWPWEWGGDSANLPNLEANDGQPHDPVFCLRVCGTTDFDLQHEICQPDESFDHFPVSVRRNIGVVRLSGEDRNDRDLRLLQGSALDRLLSDRTLRSRLADKLGETDVDGELKADAKAALAALDKRFAFQLLPCQLGLGLVGGPGFSLNALIGLMATKDGTKLPLSSWGAGTRRLAAFEVAAMHQVDHPIIVVDEVERGLESYRQRILMEELIASSSQVFVTTHSAPAVNAAVGAALWYVDAGGKVGSLPASVAAHQKRDPETFLARLAVIAEGATEVGFVTTLLTRSIGEDIRRHGIWVSDGGSNSEALTVLRGLAASGLAVAGFADNEGTQEGLWQQVKDKLGELLMRWPVGCLETNIVPHLGDHQIEAFITDPDGGAGERLRTLADRLGIQDKSLAAVLAATDDIRQLIVEAACGSPPPDPDAPNDQKKEWKKHGQRWFKSSAGGAELAEKMFALGLWPNLSPQLLPFVNAVRTKVGLAAVPTVN